MREFGAEEIKLRNYLKFFGVFILVFALAFSTSYFLYPDGIYGKNFDLRVDSNNPEENVSFDGRNVQMVFKEGNKSIVNGNLTRRIEFEGRRNDIFAVKNKVYMFYFDSGQNYLRLLRIEEL